MRAKSVLAVMAPLLLLCLCARAQGDPRLGVHLPDAAALMRLPAAPPPPRKAVAQLPHEVDLSGRLPPPGDQGYTNTCAGWAVGYGICSSMLAALSSDSAARDLPPDSAHLYSPWFIYALALHGAPCGSDVYLSDALRAADSAGCCTWAALPFDTLRVDRDCMDLPAAAVKQASYLRLASVHRLDAADADAVRAALALGDLVVINANVDSSFGAAGDRAGGLRPFTWRPCTFNDTYGHAMVCTGYSDADSTFLVQNSWGLRWGYRGTFRMPYAIFRSYVSEAYEVERILRAVALVPPVVHADTVPHLGRRVAVDLAQGSSVQHRTIALTAVRVPAAGQPALVRVESNTAHAELCDLYLAPGAQFTVYDQGQAYTVQRKAGKAASPTARLVITTVPAEQDPALQRALEQVHRMQALGAH